MCLFIALSSLNTLLLSLSNSVFFSIKIRFDFIFPHSQPLSFGEGSCFTYYFFNTLAIKKGFKPIA